MNRRRTIILLCTLLPLFLMGCQTYTSSKGKAAIEPIASIPDEKIITKPSVLQERQEALLREKALQEQQEQAALVARTQQEMEEKIALLTERELKLENSLAALNSRLETATQENQQLVDTLTELSLEKEAITLETQQSTQESAQRIEQLNQESSERIEQLNQENAQRIEQLQSRNATLANEISELQSLIEENKTIQQEQKAERLLLEQEREALLEEQQKAYFTSLQDLTDERDALVSENRMLKAQLEEKTLTIEEKVRLEQLRSDEAKRLEQEKLEKRQELEAEQQRLASQEEAKRLALEKEWRQIPPLDEITYPRLYKTGNPTSFAKEGEKLRTLMLPLDDIPWKESTIVAEVHKSISDLDIPIVFVTGHMENVIALVKEMRSNAALFSTGAIITSFPIQDLGTYGMEIQYQEKKNLRLIVANLPEYQVVQQFTRAEPWQATQKKLTKDRLTHLQGVLGEGSRTVATLLGASLYEPSYRDWNTFSPVAYRQIDYLWPLSAFLEEEGFFDTYRLTHFSEATNAGNTLVTPDVGRTGRLHLQQKGTPPGISDADHRGRVCSR